MQRFQTGELLLVITRVVGLAIYFTIFIVKCKDSEHLKISCFIHTYICICNFVAFFFSYFKFLVYCVFYFVQVSAKFCDRIKTWGVRNGHLNHRCRHPSCSPCLWSTLPTSITSTLILAIRFFIVVVLCCVFNKLPGFKPLFIHDIGVGCRDRNVLFLLCFMLLSIASVHLPLKQQPKKKNK